MVKFDVFRRINTGGVALNSQEVRNIMADAETRNLLTAMAASNEFLKATRCRVNDVRMGAQELCLRFIAYYKIYDKKEGFLSFYEMTKLLDETILELNGISAERIGPRMTYEAGGVEKITPSGSNAVYLTAQGCLVRR